MNQIRQTTTNMNYTSQILPKKNLIKISKSIKQTYFHGSLNPYELRRNPQTPKN